MSNKSLLGIAAALLLASSIGQAAEVAVIDTKAACEKPVYPRASLMNEETGVVTIALQIGVDGTPTDSKIEKSSGFKNLDKAARAALIQCKFKPVAGQAWAMINYEWKL